MKYYDYHLEGYSVRNYGTSIVFHLVIADQASEMEFSDVTLYHFIHTGGAIITDISETPVSSVLACKWDMIPSGGVAAGESSTGTMIALDSPHD